MDLVVAPDGTVKAIYDETLDLALLGHVSIRRASSASVGSAVAPLSFPPADATSSPTGSGVTVALVETASPSSTASATPSGPPVPTPSRGVDIGLLAAALAGGGLAGLALLRLLAARRGAP